MSRPSDQKMLASVERPEQPPTQSIPSTKLPAPKRAIRRSHCEIPPFPRCPPTGCEVVQRCKRQIRKKPKPPKPDKIRTKVSGPPRNHAMSALWTTSSHLWLRQKREVRMRERMHKWRQR